MAEILARVDLAKIYCESCSREFALFLHEKSSYEQVQSSRWRKQRRLDLRYCPFCGSDSRSLLEVD